MVKIAPSILSANFMCLKNELTSLEKAGADYIHFDVMDGHFVDNMTFGPMILKQAKKYSNLIFDVHLMVNNPKRFIPWYANAGADIITFHIEASSDPIGEINLIKKHGTKIGISIKPETDISVLEPLLDEIDLILVMSVNPGFGGQSFDKKAINKINKLKTLIGNRDVLIEVDGGINPETAKSCIDAGADILVAGTAIFKDGNYDENIKKIKGE